MRYLVGEDVGRAAELGARWIEDIVHEALGVRGRFTVALASGAVAGPLYRALQARPAMGWTGWEVFFGDELDLAPGDPRSCHASVHELLLSQVPIDPARVHPMQPRAGTLEQAARRYEQCLREVLGEPPALDLVLLGLGDSGHTLALYPGCPALHEAGRLVVALPESPLEPRVGRLSLAPRMVREARHVLVLAHGTQQAAALYEVLEGPEQRLAVPAQLVRDARGEVGFVLDQAAAAASGHAF